MAMLWFCSWMQALCGLMVAVRGLLPAFWSGR